MATNHLSAADVPNASTPGKLRDGDGLWLDVRSATSASWVFKFTFGGKADEMGLGSRNKVSLERARELRAWAINELANLRNPKASLKLTKLELIRQANAPKAATVYETARDNIALITGGKLKSEKGRTSWVRSMHQDFIGHIANMNPADVTDLDVLPLLTRLYADKPVYADDIRQRLAKLLGWACRKVPGWSNPVRWEGLLEHDVNRGEHAPVNHAALPAFRVGKFVADLRKREENAPAMRLALEWHIISATRPGEAAALDWAWFDWPNDCVIYPASVMKMRRAHRAPLTDRHHEILSVILDGAEPPLSGPVFSVRPGKPVSVPGLRRVMQSVQAKDCTLHGFRSSFRTWAAQETYPVTLPSGEVRRVRLYDEALLEECLAHMVGGEVRNAYVRDDFLELRRAPLEAWATYCGTVQENEAVAARRRAFKVAA